MKRSAFAAMLLVLDGLTGLPALAEGWVGSWATSQQIPEPHNALAPDALNDATLRQIVHLSAGGKTLRVHLSNAFGTEELHIDAVHVAKPLSPAAAAVDQKSDLGADFPGGRDDVYHPCWRRVPVPIRAAFAAAPRFRCGHHACISEPPPRSRPAIRARARPPISRTAHRSPPPICRTPPKSNTGSTSPASMCPQRDAPPSWHWAIPSPMAAARRPMAMTAGRTIWRGG